MSTAPSPVAVAVTAVDCLLRGNHGDAAAVLGSRPHGDMSLAPFLREVINIAVITMGDGQEPGWFEIDAPSPGQAEAVRRYLAGQELPVCALCSPELVRSLAGTAAYLFEQLHGPRALAVWRCLRDAFVPMPTAAPPPQTQDRHDALT